MAEMSNLQVELLRLYANGISEESLKEIKTILAKHFADRATAEMDSFLDEQTSGDRVMIDWVNEHGRAEDRSGH